MDLIVDSCIYIDWLRQRKHPVRVLEPFLTASRIWGCGVIRVEVLRGVIDETLLQQMTDYFDILPLLKMDQDTWRKVGELAWKLDRSGKVLPVTDVVIAVAAIEAGAMLITRDQHFQNVPGLHTRKTIPKIEEL